MIKNLLRIFLGLLIFFIFTTPVYARDPATITDWYIKDFQSEITVNKDSSLDITERITADCGNLPDKHGIFRILPTQYQKTSQEAVATPIKLTSITDFNGRPIKYQTINSYTDHTVTWKIGDPNIAVTGVNDYQIKYRVQNAIRFDNNQFDEFYWNVNGAFWDLGIDAFRSVINFPSEINKDNTQVILYSGDFKSKTNDLADYQWDGSKLIIVSKKTLGLKQGITVSVALPKNIFTPYVPGFWEKYGLDFFLILPILVLLSCFLLWSKYGRDPKINPTIVPEFEVPQKLPPMELGAVLTDGAVKSRFISAAIVNLAVKKIIRIVKIEKKGIFGSDDYKLQKLEGANDSLIESEKVLVKKLFNSKQEVLTSELKNNFYQYIPEITETVVDPLAQKKLVQKRDKWFLYGFIFLAMILAVISVSLAIFGWQLLVSFLTSAIIVFVFAFLLRSRTSEGAELLRQIKGFKLYIETAEKYREQFNEKENIFEKFLPYAIVFGIASLWAQKMKLIYGSDYFNTYHSYWYVGAIKTFNVDTFSAEIESLSLSMASTIASAPSSSGVAGGGFAGGGGGGGGGGGW